ncbi:MAG TPA: 3-deoxy-7-phosphoheptulonate synthase, partial [Gammaproteobacteria bacterium]|nr:3-deoxy-7-phosphoheptulonate synthase [Gammaproteobacteria bacterium]
SLKIAIDAMRSVMQPHHFLSLTKEGRSAIFSTTGNDDCHIILRGGKTPNYDEQSVDHAGTELAAAQMPTRLMIDFSHANSRKQAQRQVEVGAEVARQIAAGNPRIIGAMIESHLVAGRQDVTPGAPLTYGQSITDACIGWPESEALLGRLAEAVRQRRKTYDQAAVS